MKEKTNKGKSKKIIYNKKQGKEKRVLGSDTILYKNENAYLKDLMNKVNNLTQVNDKMAVLKDFFLWISKNNYDANNACVLVEYEKRLQEK